MRDLNKAYELPDPPSWQERLRRRTAEAITALHKLFNIRQQVVTRVSM